MEYRIAENRAPETLRTTGWEGTPHLIVFAACFFILAGSLILTPAQSPEDPVRLGAIALPGMCSLNNLTGLPCPGCGLVRSMVAAGHGQFEASLAFHRLGLITFAYILLQLAFRGLWLLLPLWRMGLQVWERPLNHVLIALGGLFILNWGITLYTIVARST
jgi:hypothetical protein